MKIKKINKNMKKMSLYLFGVEYGNPHPLTLDCVGIEDLRNLLCQDEFGLYKKENIKIPFKYRKKYKKYKRLREELIYAKYYNLKITAKYGLQRQYYLFDNIVIPSKSDKIVIEKLLNKG